MKVGMFKQVLCKEVVFPLPECFMGMSLAGAHFTYLGIKSKFVDEVLMEVTVKNRGIKKGGG